MGKFEIALVVLAIILLLFGAKNLPKLARSLGDSVKELKRGFKNDEPTDIASSKSTSDSRTATDGTSSTKS